MSVDVDLREVIALTRVATSTLERTGDEMKRVLDRAAAEERRTHRYNNQTHRLENSTFALGPTEEGGSTVVEFGARMEYASFVNSRGLMRVDELATVASVQIEDRLNREAERVGEG